MTAASIDPFTKFKQTQREGWASFLPVEMMTTLPAAKLVDFAQVGPGQRLLDVGCGTGVVAITAAGRGAKAFGLDLTPVLLERARHNASVAGVEIDFVEGDVEALPYPDSSFEVVLSQFGHMFAPRPAVAVQEMLRVLKVGGQIAFSTWPPEHFIGRMFTLVARHMPPPPPGGDPPAPPPAWGDPHVIRQRLGALVTDLSFERETLIWPALSVQHFRLAQEQSVGPLMKLVSSLQSDPPRLERLRADYDAMAGENFERNAIHLHFLMTRATKV